MDSDQDLRSLKRGLAALALINQLESVSIARLAQALELPRTTAERILSTLAAEGYLLRSPDDKLYRLTPKVLSLTSGFSGESWITHVAAPLLARTTEAIGWPLAIAVAEGIDMHVRYTTDTLTTLWLNRRRIGSSLAIPLASSGIVQLAFSSPAQRAQTMALIAESGVESHIDDAMVAAAQRDGYAFSPDDFREQSISLPIFVEGRLTAVLVMMYMARVLHKPKVLEEYLPRLRELAAQIGDGASRIARI